MKTFPSATIITLKQRLNYVKGSIVNEIVTKDKGGQIILFAFDKGQELKEHTAPFDAILQIVEGSAEIHINKERFKMKEGDIIILPANIPHAVYGTSEFKMLLTMIKG